MIRIKNILNEKDFYRETFLERKYFFGSESFFASEFFLVRILFLDSTWDPDPGSDLHIVGALPGTQKSFKKWRNLVHVFILEQDLGPFSGPGESF